MDRTKYPLGKLFYCMLADTWDWNDNKNKFKCVRFLTGDVTGGFREGGILEYVQANDLRQGDLIHFRPTMDQLHGTLSVVHGVDPLGVVHLGNINVTPLQLHMIDKLHIAGRI